MIVGLAEARRVSKTGLKAANLSRLIEAHFAVPRGFVIGVDAYRSQLWASGARGSAAAGPTPAEAETIRSSILAQDVPKDVSAAIAEAYQRLCYQTGFPEQRVAVRASALEGPAGDFALNGAYDSFADASGLRELEDAVRRVWASLWRPEAARRREELSLTGEPGMAVIVQQMVDAQYAGTATTANPVTGNPHQVIVSFADIAQECVVSLRDLSIEFVDAGLDPAEGCRLEIAASVAEKAVLAEAIVRGPVRLDWAIDVDGLWTLQAGTLEACPCIFPRTVCRWMRRLQNGEG